MNICTMAEPPMPSTGSVWPVLPKVRKGMPAGLVSRLPFSAPRATAAPLANRLVPAAARAPFFRKSRRAGFVRMRAMAVAS